MEPGKETCSALQSARSRNHPASRDVRSKCQASAGKMWSSNKASPSAAAEPSELHLIPQRKVPIQDKPAKAVDLHQPQQGFMAEAARQPNQGETARRAVVAELTRHHTQRRRPGKSEENLGV